MAIDLALVKGKEWFRQVIEKTAPIFNGVWKDGLFSQEKCQNLLGQLRIQSESMDTNEEGQTSSEESNAPDRPKAKNRHSYPPEFRKEMAQLGISIVKQYPWEDNVSKLTRLAKKKDSRFERQYFDRWVEDEFGVSFDEKRKEIRKSFQYEFGGDVSTAEIDGCSNPVRGHAPVSPANELLAKEQDALLKRAIEDFLQQEKLPLDTNVDELSRMRENDPAFAERLKFALSLTNEFD